MARVDVENKKDKKIKLQEKLLMSLTQMECSVRCADPSNRMILKLFKKKVKKTTRNI